MKQKSHPVGTVFGNLTVIKEIHKDHRRCLQVRCKCGKISECRVPYLESGKITSCQACSRRTHGLGGAAIYHCWHRMMRRCYNPKAKQYPRYGARGIKVCARWHDVANFAEDNQDKYDKNLQIDRIDNDGDYEPSNVRWATPKENSRNRSNHVYLTLNNKTQPMSVWAEEMNMSRDTLWHRINAGWSIEDAILIPVRKPIKQRLAVKTSSPT